MKTLRKYIISKKIIVKWQKHEKSLFKSSFRPTKLSFYERQILKRYNFSVTISLAKNIENIR